MTREEAENKINGMHGVRFGRITFDKSIMVRPTFSCDMQFATSVSLRAIADILDQVGKEDGKDGEHG